MMKSSLTHYIQLLQAGEVVAFPTETVYGLGADAQNPSAVRKIFELKGRPSDNPLIVHISDSAEAEAFALHIPADSRTLMKNFWPGPLSLIFRKRKQVLDLITGGMDTVALRMPDHEVARSLISGAGPLVAPSANKSGRPSPTSVEHVRADFGPDLAIIEDPPTRIGIESTVVDVSDEPYRILRPGAISIKQLQNTIDTPVVFEEKNKQSGDQPARSPGMKYTHYSPRARVRWLSDNEKIKSSHILYLFHTGNRPPTPGENRENSDFHVMRYGGDYEKFARELYDRFRQADHEGVREIAIEAFPNHILQREGFAVALENRISKAIG